MCVAQRQIKAPHVRREEEEQSCRWDKTHERGLKRREVEPSFLVKYNYIIR